MIGAGTAAPWPHCSTTPTRSSRTTPSRCGTPTVGRCRSDRTTGIRTTGIRTTGIRRIGVTERSDHRARLRRADLPLRRQQMAATWSACRSPSTPWSRTSSGPMPRSPSSSGCAPPAGRAPLPCWCVLPNRRSSRRATRTARASPICPIAGPRPDHGGGRHLRRGRAPSARSRPRHGARRSPRSPTGERERRLARTRTRGRSRGVVTALARGAGVCLDGWPGNDRLMSGKRTPTNRALSTNARGGCSRRPPVVAGRSPRRGAAS